MGIMSWSQNEVPIFVVNADLEVQAALGGCRRMFFNIGAAVSGSVRQRRNRYGMTQPDQQISEFGSQCS